jgi:hypothetical protein
MYENVVSDKATEFYSHEKSEFTALLKKFKLTSSMEVNQVILKIVEILVYIYIILYSLRFFNPT